MTVALYVPGDRPDRFEKAVASGADIVILDLEDAVAPDAKEVARESVGAFLADRTDLDRFQVRINAGSAADLDVVGAHDVALRLPKVRGAADVDLVVERLGDEGCSIHALVEDAQGIGRLDEIARHPGVVSVALGEADLRSDLGASSPAMLEHLRMLLVVAVRAAGLGAPLMAAYPAIADLAGLEADCRAGAALGFGGRTAVHPRQVDVIARAFAPTADEVAWAERVLAALDAAGGGVATLDDGAMVDRAMRARAERILQRR